MEPTEQKSSKNEEKRRAKKKQRESKKATTTPASKPAQTQKPTNNEQQELPPNKYYENRVQQCRALKSTPGQEPYPTAFVSNVTNLADFRAKWEVLERGEHKTSIEVSIRATIISIRESSSRLRFYDIQQGQDEEHIQVVCQANNKDDFETYKEQHQHLERNDIIGVIGHPYQTAPRGRDNGELSIFAPKVILLAPCLHMLPMKNKLTDSEQRHRDRPLDFIVNLKSREPIITHHQMNLYITIYLSNRGYIGVETPILNQVASGAAAKPFKTRSNAIKRHLSLRIAPELYLKRLVVGGFDRVFEIGHVFRNEAMDLTHNPEFTSCEFYKADADYNKMMAITEDLISGLVEKPWKRIEMLPALEKACGIKFPEGEQLETEETRQFLLELLRKQNIACSPPQTTSRMLDKLVGEYIESTCINPTFIINHPKLMSPLAKGHRSIPGLTERAEAFVCGFEICNLFSELNDPFEQRERFEEQARQKSQGDEEAHSIDDSYIRTLEYGLPPTGGCGIGLDRMLMFLANNYSIREVLAFPMMRDLEATVASGVDNDSSAMASRFSELSLELAVLGIEITKSSILRLRNYLLS